MPRIRPSEIRQAQRFTINQREEYAMTAVTITARFPSMESAVEFIDAFNEFAGANTEVNDLMARDKHGEGDYEVTINQREEYAMTARELIEQLESHGLDKPVYVQNEEAPRGAVKVEGVGNDEDALIVRVGGAA